MSFSLIGTTYNTIKELESALNDDLRRNGYGKALSQINTARQSGFYFCFHKELGTIRVNDKPEESKRKSTTKKTKGPCNWKVKVKYVNDTKQWVVDYIHTHSKHIVRDVNFVQQNYVAHFDAPETDAYVIGKINPGPIDANIKDTIANLRNNQMKAQQIQDTLAANDVDLGIVQIRNIIQRHDPQPISLNEQIKALKENGFIIRTKTDANNRLLLLLITNPDSVAMVKRYGEVLVMDSTYNTNDKCLPLLNIAGFTNLGVDKLKTFIACSVLLIDEKTPNYKWALDTFKEVVWKRDHPQTKVSIINQLD
jgi:hypothetical protein